MFDIWMEVGQILVYGFIAGIAVGLFLAWDIDKERVRENYKKNWEPIILQVMEKYGD